MNFKRKYVLMGLVLLLIAWIGNIFYYQKHVLKEPIFIKYNYDLKYRLDNFNVYYISNINKNNDVEYITFPEIGVEYTSTEKWHINSDNRYYNLSSMNVRINTHSNGTIPEELKNKVLTKARVHLTNGKNIDVNIGKIYLYRDNTDKASLNSISSMASNNYTGNAKFICPKDLKIYEVDSKFPELVDGPLKISINDIPLKDIKFPINVNSGEHITVSYKFQFDKEDINRYSAYDFSIYLLTEDKKGEKGVNPVFINYWLQSPEEYDIDAMIRDRSDD